MRIKLPLTEKFLWDLHKIYANAKSLTGLIFPPNSSIDSIFKYGFYGYLKDEWVGQDKKNKGKDFYKLVQRLKNSGYLKILKIKSKTAAIITPKGAEKLFKTELKFFNKKTRKDKKWQMVLFDIPENKRKHRDHFRMALKWLGYKNLQKSIWVCPYDVAEETRKLIKRYNLESFVELLLVEKIGFK